jgi:osmoprotectant transport system ATP-binding protein
VVIVTHDLHEAAYFADEIVVMREGKIVQQGSIEELISRPANDFVKEFIAAQQNHLINVAGGD